MRHQLPVLRIYLLLIVLTFVTSCAQKQISLSLSPEFVRIDAGQLSNNTFETASATWVDADQDGDADLFVVNGYGAARGGVAPHPNFFYQNNGDGTFSVVEDHPLTKILTTSGNSTWADVDNDGDLDVFIANQGDEINELYLADSKGGYVRVDQGPLAIDRGKSFSSLWVDMDNDGLVDLHVLNGGVSGVPQADFVYRNLGNGNFESMVNMALTSDTLVSGGATWGDYDNDGDMDAFLPLMTYTQHPMYRNDGNWEFLDITDYVKLSHAPLTYDPAGEVATWVDIDNDLDLDLYRGTAHGNLDFIYRNEGQGKLLKIEAGDLGKESISSNDASWGDYDNDGDIDVVIVPWGGAAVYYQNDGTGKFTRQQKGDLGAVPNFTSGAAAEDYDNDGDLDLFITHWHGGGGSNEQNQLYRNDGQVGNWLKVNLEGVKSNRSAIGARLILTAMLDEKERSQLRVVQGKTSWRNSSSHTQHFGVGAANVIVELRIEWPSGAVDVISGDQIKINQTVKIREGDGLTGL